MLLKRHSGSDAVVVDFIKAGGLADQSGKVTVGDIIVAVNGVDVRSIPLPKICELMANRDHKAICIDTLRDGKPHQVILFRHQPSSRDVTGARLHLKMFVFHLESSNTSVVLRTQHQITPLPYPYGTCIRRRPILC